MRNIDVVDGQQGLIGWSSASAGNLRRCVRVRVGDDLPR